jgi:hypothetical protein
MCRRARPSPALASASDSGGPDGVVSDGKFSVTF